MTHLTLVRVSEDGKRLVLVDGSGTEFTVDIDSRLRTTVHKDRGAPRLENHMDSTLRPRDIQARIRAGETAESVATAAHTTVEKIMAFAGPVLAERQHVADRAQRSSVRRRAGEAGGHARTLGDAVAAHLRTVNVGGPDAVEWDSWRREDGRWTLTGIYDTPTRSGLAEFTFDPPGNFVVLDNDDARWLVGELHESAADVDSPARDDLQQARARRLGTVSLDDEPLPLGVDAIELVTDEPAPASPSAPDAVEVVEDVTPEVEEPAAAEPAPAPETEVEPEPVADEPPARRPVKKSRGRASVPSWDEIMFGGGKQD